MPLRPGLALALLWIPLAVGCGSGPRTGPEPPADLDADGLADDVEVALLARYRPFWDFDLDEFLFPISVEAWARAGGRLVAGDGVTSVEYADLPSLLAAVRRHRQGVLHPVDPPLTGAPPCPPGFACPGGAPVYAEATPLVGRPDLAWLQYWLLFGYDEKRLDVGVFNHRGDWEHVCVLVAVDSLASPAAVPLGVHFHHHGSLVVRTSPEWVACRAGAYACDGERHPRVFLDRGGHGSYSESGVDPLGPHRGGRPGNGGLLETPLVPIRPNRANADRLDDDVVRGFAGQWGHLDAATTSPGPGGPLVLSGPCDHDLLDRPTLADWTPACLEAAALAAGPDRRAAPR